MSLGLFTVQYNSVFRSIIFNMHKMKSCDFINYMCVKVVFIVTGNAASFRYVQFLLFLLSPDILTLIIYTCIGRCFIIMHVVVVNVIHL
ncbi:hypothetical protein KUTeg_016691 [Tegillarca granosa]|uniref:Uncharacterized protein n=1 Tax=Tegillarca granosa TaxID=220873 RepID=A0ABQ9EQG6_TEGGR|nr:hypothetical protein KUTeg_016691 [Tegillarca granosa]